MLRLAAGMPVPPLPDLHLANPIKGNNRMTALVTRPPAVEPVTLAEARAQMRVSDAGEDALIERLIAAARAHVEQLTRRALISQGWRLYLDDWPAGRIVHLPVAPVVSVETVIVYDDDGLPVVLDDGDVTLERAGEPPRLKLAAGAPAGLRGFNGIEIDFTVGYGVAAGDVPEPLRHAVLLLAAHWFDNREAFAGLGGGEAAGAPAGFTGLLAAYRRVRL
jgi:uncharacterized phiE125 gp8 family phage protein